jgi:hypothetical protein
MPDVVLHYAARNWLLLVESVTSHGPVDGKRHAELDDLFSSSTAGLIYVTAFPNRAIMGRYLVDIAWETEVWVADAPSHLIHFDGERFLGPYDSPKRIRLDRVSAANHEVISSIPQLAGSRPEPVPGAHWSASPPAERHRCPRTRSSFNTVCH